MLRNLLSIYKDSILFPSFPEISSDLYYIFFDEANREWLGVPKSKISEKELNLLKTLYQLVEIQPAALRNKEKRWHDFLFLDGKLPPYNSEDYFRFIQFHVNDDHIDQTEIESALKGFFTEEVIIIWLGKNTGMVIEEKSQISLSEEELISISETIISDLFVNIAFFIGKLHPFNEKLRVIFERENEFFSFGITKLSTSRIYTYERVFPAYLAGHLPGDLKQKINQEALEVFQQDQEMYTTIKVFLENNLNASVTAKQLYIHRNTLQYRIDKFSEKTGIGLKDFYGAFSIFLSCLLFEDINHK